MKHQDRVLPVFQVTRKRLFWTSTWAKIQSEGYSLPGRIHQCHNCLDDPNASFNPPGKSFENCFYHVICSQMPIKNRMLKYHIEFGIFSVKRKFVVVLNIEKHMFKIWTERLLFKNRIYHLICRLFLCWIAEIYPIHCKSSFVDTLSTCIKQIFLSIFIKCR